MSEKIDFDKYIMKVLRMENFGEYQQFFAHLLLHSTIAFFFITIWWPLGFISLAFGLWKELWNDGHYYDLFSNKDGKQDLLARTIGSLFPFITLIWR